jgi:hypothetical protein
MRCLVWMVADLLVVCFASLWAFYNQTSRRALSRLRRRRRMEGGDRRQVASTDIPHGKLFGR